MDYSPPGSSVHGILQARTLEWVATASSRGSSQPRDRTRVSCISALQVDLLLLSHLGRPPRSSESHQKDPRDDKGFLERALIRVAIIEIRWHPFQYCSDVTEVVRWDFYSACSLDSITLRLRCVSQLFLSITSTAVKSLMRFNWQAWVEFGSEAA